MFSGLRARLVLLVFLASLPAFGLVLYTAAEQRRGEAAVVHEKGELLARHVSDVQRELIDGARQLLMAMAPWPQLRAWDWDTCYAIATDVTRRFPQYASFVVLRPDGRVFCSDVADLPPTSLADRTHFRRAIERRDFATGEYVVGRVAGVPLLGLVYPVYDSAGELELALVAPLHLRWLEVLAREANLPPGATLTVYDPVSRVAFGRYPDPARLVGQQVTAAEIPARLLDGPPGVAELSAAGGERTLVVVVPLTDAIPGQELRVALGIPAAVAFAEADRVLNRNLIALVLALLLALGVVWVGTDLWVLRTVNRLLAVTRRMTRGDLAARTGAAGGRGELPELARAFDSMAVALERREVELHDANQRLAEDLAARHRMEAALLERDAWLSTIFDQAGVGIASTTADGRLQRVNARCCDLLGYTADELARLRWDDLVHPDDLPANRVQEQLVADGVVAGYTIDERLVHKDGTPVWSQVTISTGRVPGATSGLRIHIVQDIAERKLLEEQLRQSQKMDAVGQLAGGIAHDFNNLLTVILSCVEMLRSPGVAHGPDLDLVGTMGDAAERAASLTRQLLAFSRRQMLAMEVVDVRAIVADADKLLGHLIGEDIQRTIIAPPQPALVRADPSQLQQVIVNLALNARDAMPTGGRLTFEVAEVELDERYCREHVGVAPGWYVLLAVRDTGAGMDAAVQARIFEPFFTTKPQGKGTGLGLPTVYGIVKQSGGELQVESAVGLGSAFLIYLPRVEANGHASANGVAPASTSRRTGTLLLVEDDAAVRDAAVASLTDAGYQVLVASGGAEALQVSRQHAAPIDLLVTDVVMPGMSGRDLADHLRRERPGLPVLYLAGLADRAIVERGVVEQGVHLLPKPFTPDALAGRVREVLGVAARAAAVG